MIAVRQPIKLCNAMRATSTSSLITTIFQCLTAGLLCLVMAGCNDLDDAGVALSLYQRQQQGDQEALSELEARASRKLSYSAYYAGLAYDLGPKGDRSKVDTGKAKLFYEASAEPASKHNLGLLYLNDAKLSLSSSKAANESVKAFEMGAKQYPESMMMLAKIYQDGWPGIAKNPALSYQWYDRTLQFKKDPEAEYQAGVMLLEGKGVARDVAKAHRYFESSAKFGSSKAKEKLYQLSQGMERISWLIILINADKKYEILLKDENLRNYSSEDIKKAKNYSSLWLNAHTAYIETIKFDRPIKTI